MLLGDWMCLTGRMDTDFCGVKVVMMCYCWLYAFFSEEGANGKLKMHGVDDNLDSISCSQLLLDRFLTSLWKVRSLNVLLNSNQWLLESIERAGVQHLHLNLSGIRAYEEQRLDLSYFQTKSIQLTPQKQEELLLLRWLGCSLMLMHVLEVKQAIATFAGTALLQVF